MSLKDFPYSVVTSKSVCYDATKWCEQYIGSRWEPIHYKTGCWAVFWAGAKMPKKYEWFFKHEKDAVLFSLRWS